jgi:hypothetical protein
MSRSSLPKYIRHIALFACSATLTTTLVLRAAGDSVACPTELDRAEALARVADTFAQLIAEYDRSDDVAFRVAIVGALARRGDAPALEDVIASDAPVKVRTAAILALARTAKHISAIPVLVAVLDDPSEPLRIAAIRALAATRNPDGRIALERHASRTLSTNERAWLDRALGKP